MTGALRTGAAETRWSITDQRGRRSARRRYASSRRTPPRAASTRRSSSRAPVKSAGAINPAVLHVTDLAPTFLELAGAQHPSTTDQKLAPLLGKSLVPLLAGSAKSVRTDQDWIGEELFGNRAIRQGDWKLCYILKTGGGPGDWELFNIKTDPGETRDLSKKQPAKREALLALWDQYVKQNGVILTDDGPFKQRDKASPAAQPDE